MSRQKTCKFYMQGNCHYGSSCRFLHSDDRDRHFNNDYYDDYQPRNNRNRSPKQYYENNWDDVENNDDYYEDDHQNEWDNYQSDDRNNRRYSKRDYNTRNNYKQRNGDGDHNWNNNYNYDDRENSQLQRKYNEKNNYEENYNHRSRNMNYNKNTNYENGKNNYEKNDNYKSRNMNYNKNNNDFGYQHQNENNFENYSQNNNIQSNAFGDKIEHHYDRGYINPVDDLKFYSNEIKLYQSHMKQILESNMWPLTCFQPIGNTFAIQPVGCLNLPDVSFEEIRCDYYHLKTISADAENIHSVNVSNLVLKSRRMKEDIISLTDNVKSNLLATFKKYEQSINNPQFYNYIEVDTNSYWDMSIKSMITAQADANRAAFESFSFVADNNNSKMKSNGTSSSLKILMQTEVYGKMECDSFDQEMFTDFIPIMPPPKKNCL